MNRLIFLMTLSAILHSQPLNASPKNPEHPATVSSETLDSVVSRPQLFTYPNGLTLIVE